MNKEFIPYEQALVLKELGFDEKCFGGYEPEAGNKYFRFRGASETDIYMKNSNFKITSTTVCAPLYQQAFRWLRNNYNLYIDIFVDDNKTFGFMISYFITEGRVDKPIVRGYNTYEEAEQDCLTKLIEIVKESI